MYNHSIMIRIKPILNENPDKNPVTFLGDLFRLMRSGSPILRQIETHIEKPTKKELLEMLNFNSGEGYYPITEEDVCLFMTTSPLENKDE